MKAVFIKTKFRDYNIGDVSIRYELLPSKKIIAFGITYNDQTRMGMGENDVNFDKESDEIIKKLHDSKTHRAFKYVRYFGFDDDIEQQQWFTFPS